MRRILRWLPVPTLLVVAALLALDGQTVLGVLGVLLSLVIGLCQYIAGHMQQIRQSATAESLEETRARMMAKGNLGNLYTEHLLTDVQRDGYADNVVGRSLKALAIDPNDHFALQGLTACVSLGISARRGRGDYVDPRDIQYVRKLSRRGRKIYPEDMVFPSALGTLADAEGHHEIAQLWFQKAGELSPPDMHFWRLDMATSYAMSGDHEQEMREIEKAIESGIDVWFADLYLGRALCAQGRAAEAVAFLKRAKAERRFNSEIREWLRRAYWNQSKVWRALYHQIVQGVALIPVSTLKGFSIIAFAVILTPPLILATMRKAFFSCLSPFVKNRKSLFRRIQPDMLEVTISGALGGDRQFKAAEETCRNGLAKYPDSLKLLVNLSTSLAMQGRREEAIAEVDKALLLAPDNETLRWNREQLMAQQEIRVKSIYGEP